MFPPKPRTLLSENLAQIESNIQRCFIDPTLSYLMYNLDYEPKAIFSGSPFQLACKKNSSEKVLSQFIKQKENFVELVEIVLGVDPENNKQDTIM